MTCDLYEVFGAIIPPRMAAAGVALAYKKPEDIDGNYLSACIDEIAKPGEGGIYQNMRMQYVKLLQNIALLKSEDAAPVMEMPEEEQEATAETPVPVMEIPEAKDQ